MRNTLRVTREFEGIRVTVTAHYVEQSDGWMLASRRNGKIHDMRGPVNNVWPEAEDMAGLALSEALDGPGAPQ